MIIINYNKLVDNFEIILYNNLTDNTLLLAISQNTNKLCLSTLIH